MTPIEELIQNFQALVAHVPELLQPVIVLLAGAVPFIEGEGAAGIGIIGGIHPVIAGIAGALGNFLAVVIVVWVADRTRRAVIGRRREVRAVAMAGAPEGGSAPVLPDTFVDEPKAESKGRRRFLRWLDRFGVPGASILGPLAIPTHITSALLVSVGVSRGRVIFWQGVAIVLWTVLIVVLAWLALNALVGA